MNKMDKSNIALAILLLAALLIYQTAHAEPTGYATLDVYVGQPFPNGAEAHVPNATIRCNGVEGITGEEDGNVIIYVEAPATVRCTITAGPVRGPDVTIPGVETGDTWMIDLLGYENRVFMPITP